MQLHCNVQQLQNGALPCWWVSILSGRSLWRSCLIPMATKQCRFELGRMCRGHSECSMLVGVLFVELLWCRIRDFMAADDMLCHFAQYDCWVWGWRGSPSEWFWEAQCTSPPPNQDAEHIVNFLEMHRNLRDQNMHGQLLSNLVEHIWTHNGNQGLQYLNCALEINFMFELCLFRYEQMLFMCDILDVHGLEVLIRGVWLCGCLAGHLRGADLPGPTVML